MSKFGTMEELIFIVEESDEGGYIASAHGESIITEGDDMQELKNNIKEAVQCHFEDRSLEPYDKISLF